MKKLMSLLLASAMVCGCSAEKEKHDNVLIAKVNKLEEIKPEINDGREEPEEMGGSEVTVAPSGGTSGSNGSGSSGSTKPSNGNSSGNGGNTAPSSQPEPQPAPEPVVCTHHEYKGLDGLIIVEEYEDSDYAFARFADLWNNNKIHDEFPEIDSKYSSGNWGCMSENCVKCGKLITIIYFEPRG